MSPASAPDPAAAGPIQTVTLSTASLEETRLFYEQAMGMEMRGPVDVPAATQAAQRKLWDMPADLDWDEYHLTRPDARVGYGRDKERSGMAIRVLHLSRPTPSIHSSWKAESLGTFSMGFPNLVQADKLDARVRRHGFGALNRLEVYDVPRTDGSMYTIEETIFNAPDFVHAVGITRVGMDPLGAVDRATELGGPGYSAIVVDNGDAVAAFFLNVMGLEMRRDSVFKSAGADGAMSLPGGTEFRFAIMAAKGYGPGGHILMVDFNGLEADDNGVPPRLPYRGIGAWSFEVGDMDALMARAEAAGTEIVHPPLQIEDPLHGNIRVATLLAPNDLLIEAFERIEP